MAQSLDLGSLAARASHCAIADPDGSTMYRNDVKGADLFEHRFPGIIEVVRSVEGTSEAQLMAQVEAGAGTPGMVAFFVKLKASLSAIGKQTRRTQDTVKMALTPMMRMALGELDLERAQQIASTSSELREPTRPYFRLAGELAPCGSSDDEVLTALTGRIPEEAADEILRRKASFEQSTNSTRLLYVASEPFPMAALFRPEWQNPDIVCNTWAAYPPEPDVRRVAFGRKVNHSGGVTFLDLFYLVDLSSGAPV